MKPTLIALTTFVLVVTLSQTSSAQFREQVKEADSTKTTQPKALRFVVQQPIIEPVPVNPVGGTPIAPVSSFLDPHSGITFEPISFGNGLRVKNLDPFGLGTRNGFERGDVIKSFNGLAVSSQQDLDNAVKAIPKAAAEITVSVVDINSGTTHRVPFFLTTDAGVYQTNFGVLEITEAPTNQQGGTNWSGTLRFKSPSMGTAKITGTLSRGVFTGTSSHQKFGVLKISLQRDATRTMFLGTITDNVGPMTLAIIKF